MVNKMKNNYILQILKVCVGSFLSGLGIAYCMLSGYGADPITVFFDGVNKATGMNVGTISNLTLLVLATGAFFVDKKQVGIGTFLTPFFMKFGIDYGMGLNLMHGGWMDIMWFIIGVFVIAIGIAMAISAEIGQQGTDALILGLAKKYGTQYYVIRWITDGSFLVIGLILGGKLTWGTVIATLLLGRIITFFLNHLFKPEKNRESSLTVKG